MAILSVLAVVAALALISAGAEAAPTIDGTIESGEYERMVKYDNDMYEVHWTMTDTELWMGISAQTNGWVAIGFDPTDRMKDADMVFGWVDGSGNLSIFDAYATGVNGPHPVDTDQGGTDDITEAAGTESLGWTTLEFRRDLSTGDTWDNDIPTSGTIPLIWAVGSSDDFNSQHIRRGGTMWPNDAMVEVNSAPTWVYVGEMVEVVYWINLSVWDFSDVTHTAIHWDTMMHGEPLDFNNYPNASAFMTGEADGVYEANFTAPDEPGTVYMVVHAIVDGNHFYAAMEYMVMVKAEPTLSVVGELPTKVFVNTSGEFVWVIEGPDPGEVTHTAVHWDTMSQEEPLDFNNYANMVLGTGTGTQGEYSALMTAPETPGMVYFVFHAIINGRHFYAPMEYSLGVFDLPTVTLDMAPSAVVVDGTAVIMWTVTSPEAGDVTHTAVHWDTMSHGEPLNFSAYPNAVLGTMGAGDGEYFANVTMPETTGTVYFVLHAIVMEGHYYAEMEYMIMVVEEPTLTLDTAPDAVFVDGVAMFEWSITGADAGDVTHTAIHWDTTSHGEPLDFNNYANAIMGEMGMMDGHYHANMTAPSSPTTVYYILHAIVLDVHIYAEMEYMVEVVDRPMIDEVMFQDMVFAEGMVTVMWNVSMVTLEDVTHTAVHWDTISHGEPLDFNNYANAAAGEDGSPDSDFMAMFTAPANPGSVYFVVHAIIMDEHFYAEMEYEVEVMAMPEISVVDITSRLFVDGSVKVWWDVDGVDMDDVAHTAVHWDTTSHGEPLDFNNYANAVPGMDGDPDSDYMVMFDGPSSPGSIFLVVHAIVMEEHFYAEMEYEVMAVARPTVTLVTYTEVAYLGESAKVWWDIDGVADGDLTHTAAHWDTASRAGGDMDYTAYANMVLGGDGAPDSDFMAMFNVPDPSTRVYFIVHAIVLEEDFYAEMEYSVDVFARPVFNNVDFEEKVEVGDKVTVRFTIGTSVYFDRISHVGVHWDTTSHGEPLDFEAYANAETVDPDINGVYEISFNVPDEAGNVYFVIHTVIDGNDYYVEDTEYTIQVKEAADDGTSTTTYILIAVAVIVLLAIVAFAMMGRGGTEE